MMFWRKNKRINTNESGFTILELMLAMTVFSLVLVAAAAGLIQVGRMYYKSVITTRTQDTNRAVIDEITRSVQFSGSIPNIVEDADTGDIMAFCVGNVRYTPNPDPNAVVGDGSTIGLFKDEVGSSSCPAESDLSSLAGSDGTELLGEHMRLTRFEVDSIPDTDQYRVTVWIAYGDEDDLFHIDEDTNRYTCQSGAIGSEFCAISELSSVVSRRLQ